MNILILNWRDIKNPKSGGAEKLNAEILRPFVDRGDTVIWYAQAVPGLPNEEILNGIKIIRFGNILTHLLFWPFFFYAGRFGKVDFIIDCVHGIGYLTNVFTPFIKKRILVCEVAQNVWDEMMPFPANIIGKFLEPYIFLLYSRNLFWTISQSTKNDLEKMYIPRKNILVLPMGFDALPLKTKFIKSKKPIALYVGRLAQTKGIEDAIQAVSMINKTAKEKWFLQIIGRGESSYENELKTMVKENNMRQYIQFLGFVSQEEKFKTMGKVWVLLVPSSREGWGLIVPEANFVGTQVIAYNSPGLKDAVREYAKENILVERNSLALKNALKKIKKPTKIQERIEGGWATLHRVILKETKAMI